MVSASLCDVSTCLKAPITTTQFILDDDPLIDKLEYGMGINRGGICDYHGSSTLMVDVHSDMEPFLQRRRWALLPTFEAFRTIITLFADNFNQLPSERRHFTNDLPEEEYDYQLLPVIGDDGSVLPFYHKGALVQDPRRNLLHIKSRVHPCFVIPTLLRYKATGRSEKLFPNPITDAMDTLVSIYLSVTHLPVYLSWLGPKETWTRFRRSFILAKPDPPSHRASRYDMPHLPIASPASRKRKDAGSRKPSSERSHSSTKKSVHFIGTPATKRKKRSSESTKPGTTGMTTRRTVRSR